MDQKGVIETNTSIESVKNIDKNYSTLMESKTSDCNASLFPITPYLTEEKVNFGSRFDPSTTPIEDVFDPSDTRLTGVTGLNKMNNLGTSAVRKLEFKSNECGSETAVENGLLMETVYETVLEAIICEQADDILAEIVVPDVLKTPPCVARGDGLSETCPGAPLKPKRVGKKRTVDMSLCRRKLDFDSCV